MSLALVRVDCRLIHGQIIEAWVPFVAANCLVVANNAAAGDPLQSAIMSLAVPPGVEVVICPVEDAINDLIQGRWDQKNTILLFSNCEDALTCVRGGVSIDHLNLGNLYCTPDKIQVTCSIFLGPSDFACLKEIQDMGVEIEARPAPLDRPTGVNEIISCHRAPWAGEASLS